MISAACLTSKIPRFAPEILIRTPFAPSIVVSSNGLEIAASAASSALLSPFARPIPI